MRERVEVRVVRVWCWSREGRRGGGFFFGAIDWMLGFGIIIHGSIDYNVYYMEISCALH